MKAERERKYKTSTKRELAFIYLKALQTGKMLLAFNKHLKSESHKEAVEIHEVPKIDW